MTGQADSGGPRSGEFARARAEAELATQALRARAARTVTGQAINDDDRLRLLSMLGLDDATDQSGTESPAGGETVSLPELERSLAGYVRGVAAALGVPADATGFEISDTITAYLGLPDRCADCPNRDLMLVWNEQDGWLVAAETRPTEPPAVIGYLGGRDILPHPHTVARFVTHLLTSHHPSPVHPLHPTHTARELATLLHRHSTPATGRRINPLT